MSMSFDKGVQLPCKVKKCLLYPACRNKKAIDCPDLREYYDYLMHVNKILANRTSKTWGTINMVLPKVKTIRGETLKAGCMAGYKIDSTYLKPQKKRHVPGKGIVYEE